VRLCLDEHYSDEIAVQLRAAGHDVDRVKERPELISLSDAELLATMTVERRALLTENVGDFAPPLRALTAGGGLALRRHLFVLTLDAALARDHRELRASSRRASAAVSWRG